MKPYYQDEWVTIYHGDCREIIPHLPKVDLVLTDPPYNGDIKYGVMTNDSRDWEEYNSWLVGIIHQCVEISNGPAVLFLSKPGMINMCAKYPPKWVGAWVRGPSNPAGDINGTLMIPMWEPFLIYGNTSNVRARVKDVFTLHQNTENLDHPCPKPISLMKYIIQAGEWKTILDPFLGSGTTAFAAKQLNRHCIGIDIEEKYCEIAARRCSQSVMNLNI